MIDEALLKEIREILDKSWDNGELSLKIVFKDKKHTSIKSAFSDTKYLTRVETSPGDPLKGAEEKFVSSHHKVFKEKHGDLYGPLRVTESPINRSP